MPGLDKDAFLSICIRNAEEPVKINFDAVAAETGMSVGGSKNKYRAIMKEIEDAAGATTDGTAKPTPKKSTTTKRKTPTKSAKTVEEDASENDDDDTPTKKPKFTPRKKSSTPKPGKGKKDVTKEESADGVDGDDKEAALAEAEEDGDATEGAEED